MSENIYYNIYYRGVAKFLVLGVVPLILLVYWNFNIYKIMKSSYNLRRENSNECHIDQQEKQLAITLIVIVVTFIFCHFTRIYTNLHVALVVKNERLCKNAGMIYFPGIWNVVAMNFSTLMLVINSSVNVIIYCRNDICK